MTTLKSPRALSRGGSFFNRSHEYLRTATTRLVDVVAREKRSGFRPYLDPRRSISTKPGSDFP